MCNNFGIETMEHQKFMFSKEELQAAFTAGVNSKEAKIDHLSGDVLGIAYETEYSFDEWYNENLSPSAGCNESDYGECKQCDYGWDSAAERLQQFIQQENSDMIDAVSRI